MVRARPKTNNTQKRKKGFSVLNPDSKRKKAIGARIVPTAEKQPNEDEESEN